MRLWVVPLVLLGAILAGCRGSTNSTGTVEVSASMPASTSTGASAPADSSSESVPPAVDAGASGSGSVPSLADTASEDQTPIKIGFLSTCQGAFGRFWSDSLVGMHEAIVEVAGAKPLLGTEPGSEGGAINGHPISVVNGCSDATPGKALAEARRLIEQEDVDVLVGPLYDSEGVAVADFARKHPDKTFLDGSSGAQDTTLKVQAANFFRFHSDAAQWTAGLGAYAFNVLGWRTAVTLGDDYDFPHTQTAGFVSEFCSLGGKVSKRLWPPIGRKDYSSYIAAIPKDVDGLFLAVGGTGTARFLKQYTRLDGNLARSVMGGLFMTDQRLLNALGNRLDGVVTAGMTSADSTLPTWTAFNDNLSANFPGSAGSAASPFLYGYYLNSLALMRALEAVDGDLADGQKALQAALAGLTIDSPLGPVKLDGSRNAIADNFLQQLSEKEDGSMAVSTLATIPHVDQSFGGAFSRETPTPDRQNPACTKGNPPTWTTGITREAVGP